MGSREYWSGNVEERIVLSDVLLKIVENVDLAVNFQIVLKMKNDCHYSHWPSSETYNSKFN